ncbi:MAG: SHIRT domain-containing protein [Bacteroidales bacterium]|nr:SHIRT domain-containing protein [Bacteroidales bacterium]
MLTRHGGTLQNEVRVFNLNGIGYKYLADKNSANPIDGSIGYKTFDNASSSRAIWRFPMFRRIERYLSDPNYEDLRQDPSWVESNMRFHDVYIEDSIAEAGISNVTFHEVLAIVYPPISDYDPTTVILGTGSSMNTLSFFTRLNPISGESKEDFRARVKSAPLQYGIYKDGETYTAMMFMGDWPNSIITFQNSGCENRVTTSTNVIWTDAKKQLWKEVHAADNVLGGAVTHIEVKIRVDYKAPVVVATRKQNTGNISIAGSAWNSTSSGTLKHTAQEAAPVAGSINVVKFDQNSRQPIPDMVFSLERWNGTAWMPYQTPTNEDSWTTSINGTFLINGVVSGTYRLLENSDTAFKKGYDTTSAKFFSDAAMTSEVTSFTVDTEAPEGVLLYTSNKKLVKYTEQYFYHNIVDLPENVRKTLPTRAGEYYNGNVVVPENPSSTSMTIGHVKYDFEGWDKTADTIKDDDERFTGTWKITPQAADECRVDVSSVAIGAHNESTCTPMTADGVEYPVVLVNGHCWTKENMRTAHKRLWRKKGDFCS